MGLSYLFSYKYGTFNNVITECGKYNGWVVYRSGDPAGALRAVTFWASQLGREPINGCSRP